jgi:PAS domain S-box-containing protein
MNHAINVDGTLPSRWTGIAILSLIAAALFAAIVFLGIEVSLRTQAAETYVRLGGRAYSQLQRDLLRLQVLVAGGAADVDEQRMMVASHIEYLKFAASQGEMPESIHALVEQIDVLWDSAEASFERWMSDPTNEVSQAALSRLLTDAELLANEMSGQFDVQDAAQVNEIRQSGEQLIVGTGLVSVLFVAFVGLVILNLVRFIRERQGADSKLHHMHHELEQRVQERTEALAEERNLLRTVMDNLPDSIFINDTAGRLVLDNLASRRRFAGEVSPEDVIGKMVYDFFPAELAERYLAQDQVILQTGEPLVNDEQMNLDQNGNKHWFLINKVPLRNSDGTLAGIVGIARDITERKQTEEALAKEHNLLRTVIDNLPDPIFIKDMQRRNILNNQADARFAGVHSTQELMGKTVYDFFPAELAAEFDAVEKGIMDTGQPQINREEEHIDGDGKKRWFLTTKTPLRDSHGDIIGLVGIVRDITERKQMDEALAEERNLLRTLIDTVPDNIFVKDTQSRFVIANAAVAEAVGESTPEALIGKTDLELSPPETAEAFYQDEQAVIQSGQALINREELNINRAGVRRWYLTTKVPWLDAQGNIIGIVGTSRDITERKQIQEELAREQNLLRTLMDNLPDFVYVKDLNSRFLLVNNAVLTDRDMTTPGEMIGKNDFDLHPPGIAEKFYADDQQVISSGRPLVNMIEPSVAPMTNEERWYSTTKVPLRNGQGTIIGLVGVSRDITERKRIEDELSKERNLMRTVIDNVPDLIFAKDQDSRFILANQACARFVDVASPDELIGKMDDDVEETEAVARYHNEEQALMRSGVPVINQEEFVVVERTGNSMWVSATKVPLRDPDGKVIGLVGISRDISERKQIEEALAKERNLLRMVIDTLPDLVYVKDTESRFLVVNQTVLKDSNLTTTEEMVGKTDFDLQPPEIAQKYVEHDRELIHSGQPILNLIEPSVNTDGKERWLSTTKLPLRDNQGTIIGLVGVSRDITERKRIEEELAKERNLLRTVIDNLPDLIYVRDTDSRFVLVNDACVRFVGAANPEALIGKTDFDFYAPDKASQYFAAEQALMHSGQPMRNQDVLVTIPETGKSMWVSATKVPLYDQDGKVVGLVGVSRDITERKRAEVALAEERNLLRTVIDNLPDLIYVKDTSSRYLLRNVTGADLLGLAHADEMLGKSDFDFFPADEAQKFYNEEQAIIQSGQPLVDQETFVSYTTGYENWFLVTKVPLRDQDGKITGLVGINRDITDRKRAEQALAEERNLLRTLIDNLPDYVYVKDTEGRWLLRNATGIEEVFGLASPDELIGKTDFDFFPQELARRYYDEEQAIIKSGQPIMNRETRVTLVGGEAGWLSYTKVPLRDTQGKIVGLVGTTRNITDHKQIEETLAQERNLLRTLVDALPDYVYVKDTEGRFLLRNISGIERLGINSLDEIIGKTDFDFFPREVSEELYAEEQAIIQTGQPIVNQELLITEPDGSRRWLQYTKAPLRDNQGEVIGIVGVSHDINERKQAEQALRQAHDQLEYERAQLEVILDSIGEGVIYDEKHQTRYINQSLTRLTGYSIEEWSGALHPLKSADVTEEEFEAFNQTIFESVENEGIWRGETRLQRKDGSTFDAGLTCTAVTGAAGQVIGAVTIIRDISQEKALQEQKSRFVANASHELRTPIANLKTRLYLLRKQPEKTDYHLEVMDEVTARMQRLVEDMLDVSRFERGLIPLQQQDVLLQDLISGVIRVQQAEAERKHIQLVSDFPAESLHIFADPERIIQVITNLVVNAINYTPEGGQVFVRVYRDNGDATIDVQDTGMGIAADQIHQVFQPFFRASQGISGGTGLGLTIAREIMELHGGEIGLESEIGQGACFRVKLALLTK